MTKTPEYMRDNSLRDLLISLAAEGMDRCGLVRSEVADRIGVTKRHLDMVLDKQTSGSLELWNNILDAVRDED